MIVYSYFDIFFSSSGFASNRSLFVAGLLLCQCQSEEDARQACGERLCAQCECWKDSVLMWFTPMQVRAVVVLVGECRSCLCCISFSSSGTSVSKQGGKLVRAKFRLK